MDDDVVQQLCEHAWNDALQGLTTPSVMTLAVMSALRKRLGANRAQVGPVDIGRTAVFLAEPPVDDRAGRTALPARAARMLADSQDFVKSASGSLGVFTRHGERSSLYNVREQCWQAARTVSELIGYLEGTRG